MLLVGKSAFLPSLLTLRFMLFNFVWSSDAIWRHRSGSIMGQIMAYCLTTPNHYINQCSLIISEARNIPMWSIQQGMFQISILNVFLKIAFWLQAPMCQFCRWVWYVWWNQTQADDALFSRIINSLACLNIHVFCAIRVILMRNPSNFLSTIQFLFM